MSKVEFDDSVFIDVKEEINRLLCSYQKEFFEATEAELYLVDEVAMKFFDDCKERLIMEYGYDKKIYKRYNLENIIKIISSDPVHDYKIYETEKWKQINDRELVFDRLDGYFERYKNSLRANVRKKTIEKNIDQKSIAKIMADINKEIEEAGRELEFIKNNFEELDVRISSYNERTKVSMIECRSFKKKGARKNLRKSVPNVLWFKELEKEEQIRKDNELVRFMNVAKRAFGEVYYVPFEKYNKKGE